MRRTSLCALAAAALVPSAAAQETQHGVTPVVLQWETAEWGPPTDTPGFPPAFATRRSPRIRRPGARRTWARFPAGSEFAMHWHTHTETVVVLEGAVDIVMDGTRHTATAGTYIIIPGRAHHAWFTHEEADVVLLARRDGPADFHFVDP